jgi:hypothetical protein
MNDETMDPVDHPGASFKSPADAACALVALEAKLASLKVGGEFQTSYGEAPKAAEGIFLELESLRQSLEALVLKTRQHVVAVDPALQEADAQAAQRYLGAANVPEVIGASAATAAPDAPTVPTRPAKGA